MLPEQVLFETSCPVCSGPVHYPNEAICRNCGWLVMVFSDKPDQDYIERLEKLRHIRKKDLLAYGGKEQESSRLESQVMVLKKINSDQQEQIEKLREELRILNHQKIELIKNEIFKFDFAKIEKAVLELEQESELLASKLTGKPEYKDKTVTIRCTYDHKMNMINVVVTRLRTPGPIWMELLLGVAVLTHPFDHFKEADIIIPVMKQGQPEKIEEAGQEIHLELMQWPERPVTYYRIIHLYPHTVSKFTIE
jgi:uncharacterized Zn finger protein (UPF0148 family)